MKPQKISSRALPGLTLGHWWRIGILSLVLGGFVYAAVTWLAYYFAVNRAERVPAKIFDSITIDNRAGALGGTPPADLFARSLGIEFSSEEDPLRMRLRRAYLKPTDPLLTVAAKFIRDGGASPQCESKFRELVAAALGVRLVGWPGTTADEAEILSRAAFPPPVDTAKSSEQIAKQTDEQCARYAKGQMRIPTLRGLVHARTESATGRDLAVLVLGPDACIRGGTSSTAEEKFSKCRILQGLLEAAAASEAVKESRMWVNFFWGWERFAVVVLFIGVMAAICVLRRQRRPLREQATMIADWLRQAEARLSKIRFPSVISRPNDEANILYDSFRKEYGKELGQKRPGIDRPAGEYQKESDGDHWDGDYVADAEGLCLLKDGSPTALRDLLDANRECADAPDRDHLQKFVELHTQALARQRAFISALITAFPAIGLIATLHGLIVALSRASGIVSGTDSDRFSATEFVTGVLSSSFATTMLALTAMAICMLVNTLEEHRETDLVEDTYRRLNSVFWPGRV